MDKEETLVGKRVKRLSDGKEITIKSGRMIDGIPVLTDTDGNIYEEHELDIRYRVTPWYLMFEALRDNGIVEEDDWCSGESFKSAFKDFMASMQKSGYIAREEGEHED